MYLSDVTTDDIRLALIPVSQMSEGLYNTVNMLIKCMHNELRDTPKTGDDSNPTLWLALMGVAVVGVTACDVLAMKNKKKIGAFL